jgi:Putative translation initiation inhibitor, yjgF family
MKDNIQHINPDLLMKNPAFSQIVITQGSGRTIYIGGQNAVNANREIIGKGNIQEQTKQVMENIQIALKSCGASFENIVKLNIHIVQGQNAFTAFQTSQQYLGTANAPPAITVLYVSGLANPDFLIEIDAIAFISDK